MEAFSRSKSPMKTEPRKSIRSMDAVTTFFRACRKATMDATSSISLKIVPPNTLPATLASIGIIILETVVKDSLGVFALSLKVISSVVRFTMNNSYVESVWSRHIMDAHIVNDGGNVTQKRCRGTYSQG